MRARVPIVLAKIILPNTGIPFHVLSVNHFIASGIIAIKLTDMQDITASACCDGDTCTNCPYSSMDGRCISLAIEEAMPVLRKEYPELTI